MSVTDHALRVLRREVGRRIGTGREDAGLAAERLAALLEADEAAEGALSAGVAARRRLDPLGPAVAAPPSARAARAERRWAAREAVDELVLAGRLVLDGPDRVCLPGFGASTWRAIALLRTGGPAEAEGWPGAVAMAPALDLGDAAPPFLRGLRPDPRLHAPAAALHALEALRQDHRHALISAEGAIGLALEAGHADSAGALRAECAALSARIGALDRAIAAAWDDGARTPARYARRP